MEALPVKTIGELVRDDFADAPSPGAKQLIDTKRIVYGRRMRISPCGASVGSLGSGKVDIIFHCEPQAI